MARRPFHAALPMLLALCATAVPGLPLRAAADPPVPTFNADVAPLLRTRCAPCHRPGGAAPFSLIDYEDARSRATQLVAVTSSRYMPPWLPEPGHGRFRGERRLTDAQLKTLAGWADAGAPRGSGEAQGPLPNLSTEWAAGEPDLIVRMPRAYTLAADGEDVFRNFVIPIDIDRTRWVRGFEFRPSNPRVVHHAVIRTDPTRSSRRFEEADPEPGYDGMPGSGVSEDVGHFAGWTPGNQPEIGDGTTAWELRPGTDLVVHLHLLPTGKPESVDTTIGLYFADRPPERRPLLVRLGTRTIDIPAGTREHTVEDALELPVDVEVLGVYPHAHYLGRNLHGWADLPNGEREWLIRIDRWDFNWQDDYAYVEPVRLPAGTVLRSSFVYDNSAKNPRNPNVPPVRVQFGPRSADEMGDLWLQVVATRADDRARLRADLDRKELETNIAWYRRMDEQGEADGATLAELALMEFRTGERSAAEAHIRRALQLDAGGGRVRLNAGILAQETGNLQAAARHYREAIRADPSAIQAHNNLGTALRRLGDLDGAAEQYRAVLSLEPDHPTAHNNLGVALQAAGQVDEAIAHYRRAVAVDRGSVSARLNLARALAGQGRFEPAADQYRAVLKLDPDRDDVWIQLGHALQATGRLPDAIGAYREGIAGRPDDLQGRTGLAFALARAGETVEARKVAKSTLDVARGAGDAAIVKSLEQLLGKLPYD